MASSDNMSEKIGKEMIEELIINEDSTHKPGLNSSSSTYDLSGRDFLTRAPQKLGLLFTPSVKKYYLVIILGKL